MSYPARISAYLSVSMYLPLGSVLFWGSFVCVQIQAGTGAATAARQAAARIFRLSDDSLFIDPLGEGGAKGESKSSSIEFSGVKFAYPRRPNAQARRKGVPNVGTGAAGGRLLPPVFLTPTFLPYRPIFSYNIVTPFTGMFWGWSTVSGLLSNLPAGGDALGWGRIARKIMLFWREAFQPFAMGRVCCYGCRLCYNLRLLQTPTPQNPVSK